MPEADVAELPPDIRTLLDRTADLVSTKGLEMEKRIMRLVEDDKDRRFKFLRSSDPLHALYQHKLSEYRALNQDGPAQDIQPDDPGPAQDIQPDAPATHECVRVRRAPPLRFLPQPQPHSFAVPKPPEGITLKEIGIIMLTAQFVARYGMYFLVDLMKIVNMNPQFEFMKETDSRCGYFTQLVVAYNSRVLLPSKKLSERRACNETLLKDFFDRLQLEKLEEGVEMAVSDLLAFVGGVDYFARIKYEESIATPPEYFSMLMNPPPQMQLGIPVTPPLGPKSSSGQIISNQAQADVTIIEPHPEIREIVERTALLVSQEGLEIERRIRDCNVGNRKFNFLRRSDPGHAFYQHKLTAYSALKQDGSALDDIYIQPTGLSFCDTPIYATVKPPKGVTPKEIGIMKLTAQFSARYGIDFMVELLKRVEATMSIRHHFEFIRHHFEFIDESDARCEYFSEVAVAYSRVLRRTEKLRERGACKETVLEGFFKLLQLEKQEEGVEMAMRDVRAFVGGVDYFALKEEEGLEEEGLFTGTDDERSSMGTDDEGSSTGTDDEGSSTGTDDEGSSSMTTNQCQKRRKLDGFASGYQLR